MIAKRELKEVGWLLAIVIPLFVGLILWFPHSPEYQRELQINRMQVRSYLLQPYVYGISFTPEERINLMARYHFTEDDVNIEKVLLGANK